MKTVVKDLDTDGERFVFIFTEFTKRRYGCNEIIKLLDKVHLDDIANELKNFNISDTVGELTYTPFIKVIHARERLEGSNYYPMTKKVPGQCIILNNVSKQCYNESERFRHVFEQLHFKVDGLDYNWDAKEIEQNLTEKAKKVPLNSDAFTLVIISHGLDEKIVGYKGCLAIDILRDNPDDKVAQATLMSDLIDIKSIANIFSDINCRRLKGIPKIMFFVCCREPPPTFNVKSNSAWIEPVTDVKARDVMVDNSHLSNLQSVDKTWIDDNRDTFIGYSCAQGYETLTQYGISRFGLSLTHMIAKYACEEPLTNIMTRTCNYMQTYFDESGCYAPGIFGKCLRRQICFNPGTN